MRGNLGFGSEVFQLPSRNFDFIGQFLELGDLSCGEKEAAACFGALSELGFHLSGKEALFISVTEDVIDDGFEVFLLGNSARELATGPSIRVDALEVETSGGLGALCREVENFQSRNGEFRF